MHRDVTRSKNFRLHQPCLNNSPINKSRYTKWWNATRVYSGWSFGGPCCISRSRDAVVLSLYLPPWAYPAARAILSFWNLVDINAEPFQVQSLPISETNYTMTNLPNRRWSFRNPSTLCQLPPLSGFVGPYSRQVAIKFAPCMRALWHQRATADRGVLPKMESKSTRQFLTEYQ